MPPRFVRKRPAASSAASSASTPCAPKSMGESQEKKRRHLVASISQTGRTSQPGSQLTVRATSQPGQTSDPSRKDILRDRVQPVCSQGSHSATQKLPGVVQKSPSTQKSPSATQKLPSATQRSPPATQKSQQKSSASQVSSANTLISQLQKTKKSLSQWEQSLMAREEEGRRCASDVASLEKRCAALKAQLETLRQQGPPLTKQTAASQKQTQQTADLQKEDSTKIDTKQLKEFFSCARCKNSTGSVALCCDKCGTLSCTSCLRDFVVPFKRLGWIQAEDHCYYMSFGFKSPCCNSKCVYTTAADHLYARFAMFISSKDASFQPLLGKEARTHFRSLFYELQQDAIKCWTQEVGDQKLSCPVCQKSDLSSVDVIFHVENHNRVFRMNTSLFENPQKFEASARSLCSDLSQIAVSK